jgi:hypothetical protein
MNLDDIPKRFANHFGDDRSAYTLNPRSTSTDLESAELRLSASLPADIATFFHRFNGCLVPNPHVEILPLNLWTRASDSLVQFAWVDFSATLCFDTLCINDAGQWDIVCPGSRFRITHTFASLFTVHIWKWIDRRIPFWLPDWLDYAQGRKTHAGG